MLLSPECAKPRRAVIAREDATPVTRLGLRTRPKHPITQGFVARPRADDRRPKEALRFLSALRPRPIDAGTGRGSQTSIAPVQARRPPDRFDSFPGARVAQECLRLPAPLQGVLGREECGERPDTGPGS